jgi:hypothetical protein
MIEQELIDKAIQAIRVFETIETADWHNLDRLAVHMGALIFNLGLSQDDYYHPLLNEMRKIRRQFGE